MKPGASSERAVILAPTGRDASVAAALIKEAGYYANVCGDLSALLHEVESGAGLAVIADEAIKTADLRGLMQWLNEAGSMEILRDPKFLGKKLNDPDYLYLRTAPYKVA